VVAGCSSELYACVPVFLNNNFNQIAITALLFYTSSSLALDVAAQTTAASRVGLIGRCLSS
ncbi:hypothetical protein XENOCAPTIV_007597, partial [Xenoophorus captivus]